MPPRLTSLSRLAAALAAHRPAEVTDTSRVLAAVAVVLVEQPDAVLLIRRAERVGDRWSGQMAFPGGRWEPPDPTLAATAKRETMEEVGIDLSGARLIGVLDDVAPRTPILPPITVRPFVFHAPARLPFAPNEEVADATWMEIDRLLEPGVYRPFQYVSQGVPILLPGYHLPVGVVWGMTERILTPLLDLLKA